MKRFNLEEYLKNPTKSVVTRDGRNVKIHCTDYLGVQPIFATIEGDKYPSNFCKNGRYMINKESPRDLFFATKKHERWVNLYKSGLEDYSLGRDMYISKERAEAVANSNCVSTVKIEWEE